MSMGSVIKKKMSGIEIEQTTSMLGTGGNMFFLLALLTFVQLISSPKEGKFGAPLPSKLAKKKKKSHTFSL